MQYIAIRSDKIDNNEYIFLNEIFDFYLYMLWEISAWKCLYMLFYELIKESKQMKSIIKFYAGLNFYSQMNWMVGVHGTEWFRCILYVWMVSDCK